MKFENIKKHKIDILFTLLGLVAVFGGLVGLAFSDNFTQFKSRAGEVLGEKEQQLLDCFAQGKDGCLTKVERVQYGEAIWDVENTNISLDNKRACYDDKPIFCDQYGGYYTFKEARAACAASGMQLPTVYDFQYLYAVFESQDRFIFDMNMLPGGAIIWGETSSWQGDVARYWAQDPFDEKSALYYGFTVGKEPVSGILKDGLENSKLSVRCMKYDWQ